MPRVTDFHKSIWSELEIICNRVRNLVNHWWEDWRYKEAILMNIIKKFLPKNYSIWTWFIVSRWTERDSEHISSNQIDLIIYNNSFPTLFSEWDFIIVTPDSVKWIIEVKSNLKNQWIWKVINKCNENWIFIKNNSNNCWWIFNWVFSYYWSQIKDYNKVKWIIRSKTDEISDVNNIKYLVNHISFNADIFLKYWNWDNNRYNKFALYNIKALSYSYFISNLLWVLNNSATFHERALWYPEDKETWKIWTDF